MSIRVTHPGAWATVQDLGRPGHSALGVSACGAADAVSLIVGNRLVGNRDGAAAVEMTLVGGRFEFATDAIVALTGAPCAVVLEQRTGRLVELPLGHATSVLAGERVRAGAMHGGARTYLCVRGGIATPPTLGSRSTHTASGLGGLEGRALRAGDVLPIGGGLSAPRARAPSQGALSIGAGLPPLDRRVLRVSPGTHAGARTDARHAAWARAEWTVSPRFDRTGLRLAGAPGAPAPPGVGTVTSEAVGYGSIQRTESGELIILGPDAPPTGGYPVVGTVCGADLCAVGQLRAGDRVRFELVESADTRRLTRALWRAVNHAIAPATCAIDLNCDLGEDESPGALARDTALVGIVTSINIACGAHAGSEATMRMLLRAAAAAGTHVGAHPGYPDRAQFGRARLPMSPAEIERSVHNQVSLLARLAREAGVALRHVKPHGALYHDASRDDRIARAVLSACRAAAPGAALVGLAGSRAAALWQAEGATVMREGFADRVYAADGSLQPRAAPGAVVTDPAAACAQALDIARDGRTRTGDRSWIIVEADTLCVHGDTPGALDIARAVRAALDRAGVHVRAPAGL